MSTWDNVSDGGGRTVSSRPHREMYYFHVTMMMSFQVAACLLRLCVSPSRKSVLKLYEWCWLIEKGANNDKFKNRQKSKQECWGRSKKREWYMNIFELFIHSTKKPQVKHFQIVNKLNGWAIVWWWWWYDKTRDHRERWTYAQWGDACFDSHFQLSFVLLLEFGCMFNFQVFIVVLSLPFSSKLTDIHLYFSCLAHKIRFVVTTHNHRWFEVTSQSFKQ